MNCIKCGALLRGAARFCNVCGTQQPSEAAPPPPAVDETGGRVKRPSRPLRPSDTLGPGFAAPASRPLERRTMVLDDSSAPNFQGPAHGPWDTRDELADMPTSEYAALAASGDPNAPHAWPLVIGDVLHGRYQIASVVSTSQDQPGAENRYHITDQRGYEKCWSCHTVHGSEAQGERFCPQCGADMVGHEYLLIEQRPDTEHDTRPEMPASSDHHADSDGPRVFEEAGRLYEVAPIEADHALFPFGPHVTMTGVSHVGITRAGETNEDSFGSLALDFAHDSQRQPLAFAIVADGLGGHASGQDASRLASRVFIERLTQLLALPLMTPLGSQLPPDEAVESALRDAVLTANDAVYQANQHGAGDMGATLVAFVIVGEMAWIANLGDSRAYVFDGVTLRRATSDHSLVEQLILGGLVTPEERYTHPQRNRIFRSLGGDPKPEADIFTQKLRPGMRLLLCSDGLWEMTHDPEIERILRETVNPYEACEALIASANANGGEDNITAVIAQIDA